MNLLRSFLYRKFRRKLILSLLVRRILRMIYINNIYIWLWLTFECYFFLISDIRISHHHFHLYFSFLKSKELSLTLFSSHTHHISQFISVVSHTDYSKLVYWVYVAQMTSNYKSDVLLRRQLPIFPQRWRIAHYLFSFLFFFSNRANLKRLVWTVSNISLFNLH